MQNVTKLQHYTVTNILYNEGKYNSNKLSSQYLTVTYSKAD